MKVIEKIIKTLLNILIVIFVLAVIIVIYNFVQINLLHKSYSSFFGYTAFEISTGSMSGTMEISDVIIVKITDDVHKDDIVTYEKNGEIITHRIIGEDGDKLITKGDANNGEDDPIEKNMIIGKVVKVVSKLGIWFKVLSDSKVIICIVITIIFFGLAMTSNENEISGFKKNLRGNKSNEEKAKKE